jgi:hypothetical protein
MAEEWKDIPGYEGFYQASTLGRIRSLRVLKGSPSQGTRYLAVRVGDGRGVTSHVHALVARAFHGPRPLGLQVNHIDGDRTNNSPDNLEYLSVKGNSHHAFKIGNRKHYFTDQQMDEIAKWFFEDGMSATDIARKLAPEPTLESMRRVRKKIRSVTTIWRASARTAGKKNPHEDKLTMDSARKIREIYAAGGIKQSQLALMFNCHPAHISRVVNNLMWPENLTPST